MPAPTRDGMEIALGPSSLAIVRDRQAGAGRPCTELRGIPRCLRQATSKQSDEPEFRTGSVSESTDPVLQSYTFSKACGLARKHQAIENTAFNGGRYGITAEKNAASNLTPLVSTTLNATLVALYIV